MQSPVSAALMREREAITAFLRRVLLRVEALVDHDAPIIEENRAEDVGIETEAGTRHAEQLVGIVELEAELEVLLDDVLDRDRRLHYDTTRLRIFGKQYRGIALDRLVGKVRNEPAH